MKGKDILNSMGGIDEKYAEEYEAAGKAKKKNGFLTVFVPVAACAAIALTAGFIISKNAEKNTPSPVSATDSTGTDERQTVPDENASGPSGADYGAYSLVSPAIPVQAQITEDWNSPDFDAYSTEKYERVQQNRTDFDFTPFFEATAGAFLGEKDGKNKIYSPVNVYIALSMLASCTGGETRQQILGVLGAGNEDLARETAMKLLRGNYVDDGSRKSLLTNSIWTGEKYPLNDVFLRQFSDDYYAPVFSGDAADPAYSEAFQNWLTAATGGLLESSAKELKFDPEMALTLASTLYFAAKWDVEFDPENNTDGVFHGANADENCAFMNSDGSGTYFAGDCFGAVQKWLGGGGSMYFILPDEGVSPEDVMKSKDLTSVLYNPDYTRYSYPVIHLSVPKFDVTSDMQLKESLQRLGVTNVFEAGTADFSPVSGSELFLSKIQHSARVAIDEQGVVAAAFTIEMLAGAGIPSDEIDFTLDRPFIFAITGETGDLLFIGIVNSAV